jgi:hypothetical protein
MKLYKISCSSYLSDDIPKLAYHQLHLNQHVITFSGAFAKLRKAIISFVISVRCLFIRLSVLMEQLGSHWADFHEI